MFSPTKKKWAKAEEKNHYCGCLGDLLQVSLGLGHFQAWPQKRSKAVYMLCCPRVQNTYTWRHVSMWKTFLLSHYLYKLYKDCTCMEWNVWRVFWICIQVSEHIVRTVLLVLFFIIQDIMLLLRILCRRDLTICPSQQFSKYSEIGKCHYHTCPSDVD